MRRMLYIATLLSFLLSLVSAQLVDALLTGRMAIVGRFVGLQYSLNPGIAFGIRLPAGLQEVLIGFALIGVVILAIRTTRTPVPNYQLLVPIAFGLILGGGLANIVDRLQDGFVTDFIQIGWWPVFNVADSFVVVGVFLLFLKGIRD